MSGLTVRLATIAPRRLYSSSTVPTSHTVEDRFSAVRVWASAIRQAQPPRSSSALPSARLPLSFWNFGL